MRIATFLPHVRVFGGVRRFLELGNAWVRTGHEVTLYHPAGDPPGWLEYHGRVAPLREAEDGASDLAVCADPHTYAAFRGHRSGRHLYYCVLEKDPGLPAAIADTDVGLAANSGPLRHRVARRSGREVLDGIGGVNPAQFFPAPARTDDDAAPRGEARRGVGVAHDPRPGAARALAAPTAPVRVLLYGRRSRPKKGTDLALRALAGLIGRVPSFEVAAFDHREPDEADDPRDGAPATPPVRWVLNPTQSELVDLYRWADVFVAAERKAGWCNTALEAMACGCAVVCTRSGTTDFARHGTTAWVVPVRHAWFLRRGLRRVLRDDALRATLRRNGPPAAAAWSWDRLAAKLLRQVVVPGTLTVGAA